MKLEVVASAVLLLGLTVVPVYAHFADEPFLLTQVARILVFGIAASALNLALGYGGLVSFGHAMYLGLGAYSVGLLSYHGVGSGWWHLAAALVSCALVGTLAGLIVLRTSGIAFIMITLALAQMLYFLFVSLKQYGGDDGLSIDLRSDFGLFSLDSALAVYLASLGLLLLLLLATQRLVGSHFGLVLRGARSNERRVRSLGFSVMRFRLLAYVLSAMVTGLAGVLLANLTGFASPSYLAWTVSGELIVMVVLGGTATVIGPLAGSVAFLLIEEGLKGLTDHWMLWLGAAIVLLVMFTSRGLAGLFKP